jgi:hypothetical protein
MALWRGHGNFPSRDERLTVFAERIRELIGRARGGAR